MKQILLFSVILTLYFISQGLLPVSFHGFEYGAIRSKFDQTIAGVTKGGERFRQQSISNFSILMDARPSLITCFYDC